MVQKRLVTPAVQLEIYTGPCLHRFNKFVRGNSALAQAGQRKIVRILTQRWPKQAKERLSESYNCSDTTALEIPVG